MKPSLRRRRLALLVVTALAATPVLAACGADDGAGDGGPVTLDVWARDGDNSLDKQVAAFEKAHPDIAVDVTLVNNDQYLTKFANSIRAGSVPDLIDFDIINAPLLATQGQLLDITDKTNGLPNLSDVATAGVDIGTLDDAVYSLPVALTGSQMFWNKKLFTEAGLDPDTPPKDLAQVKAYAEKIQALGDDITGFSTIGGVGQAFTGFPSGWADGGDVFTEAGPDQTSTFDDPAMVGMVSWYQDMWESGLMQPTDEPNQDPGNVGSQNALAGKVGIMFTGANVFAGHEDEFGSAAGIPGSDGELASFLGGNQAAIPLGSEHPDEAWTLLEWLVTDREAATINGEAGWIAPDLKLADDLAEDEWSTNRVGSLAVGKLPKSIAYFATINDPNGPWAQNSQAAIFQGADPKTALEKAAQQADQLIADAYNQVG
ncbi:ABC transporter substrate-binding protein [Isoptericola sp. NPDC057191]|uniref:ABC transporter substrate-binding protein n=1 Tax=Isoptericola sp. NPDC057191 TaxID=3346041 RepID=UPI00363D3151